MWSKQADVSNKNVTSSFKNKITNRKQRVSKSSTVNNGISPSVTTDVNNKLNICENSSETTEKSKQKSKKNRKSSVSKTTQEDSNKKNTSKSKITVAQNNNKNKSDSKSATNETDQNVVLRNSITTSELTQKKDDVIKRYSDTFIVENGRDVKKSCDIVDGAIPHCDKSRKNRRFSDLFKTSSAFSGSVEDFKSLSDKVLHRQNSELNLKKSDKNEMAKSTDNKNCAKEPQNSYLKRVRSRIYKSSSKSETPNNDKKSRSKKIQDSGIPEECELELRKSSSNFDFRLLRQTSNLEGIWPLRRHCEEVDGAREMDSLFVKPTLEKAKSSSAINLNLLRTRRNKIMEQVKKRNCQEAKNEFEFVGFGNAIHDSLLFSKRLSSSQTHVGDMSRRLPPSWIHETIGESKPSQPVSRSGSDRRPDSVREESAGGRNQDSHAGGLLDSNQNKSDDSPVESSVSLPSSGNKKRNATNINRSESVKEQSEKQRKQRRNISDPSQNASSSHDIEQSVLSNTTDSGSSSNSNSSISFNGRLSESPSNPNDSRGNKSDGDSDMDADSDHINWQDLISTEQLNNLPPHEKKRQDVINELFCTEKSHMRSLNVLHKIFYKPLQKSQVLKPEELSLIFPNIQELLQIHRQFNHEMTQKRREDPIVRNLGDLLLNMFSGSTGEAFKEAAAKFCERQQLALELIKERRKRDSKFDSILSEGEKKRQCRRLQFQAILPAEMQRLSKLPLLLERLICAVQEGNGDEEELNKLNKAYQLSKEIVNHVNEAAKMALNQARLEEIQKHLDQSNFERSNDPISQEFRPLDLTKYKLVREGPMHLRRPNKNSVLVHVLLMEEVVVILHKEGDRYVLKNFHSGASGQTNPLSPIIKISTLLVRINAVCKNALFLVNTSTMNSQMYDLRAEDDTKRDVWFKHFSDVTDAHNKKEGKTRRTEATADNDDEESVQEFPQPQDVSERAEEVDHVENEESHRTTVSNPNDRADLESEVNSGEQEDQSDKVLGENDGYSGLPNTVTAEEWPLIQPSQVHIAVLPVHTAESRLTPLEQIRRKDEEINRALQEKQNLIADLLSIPQQEFHTIADMVSEEDNAADSINLTMALIHQTNRLQKVVNDVCNLTDESDLIQATGGQNVSCSSQIAPNSIRAQTIPHLTQIREIANKFSKHLTELLEKQKQLEDENNLLRNELFKTREKLHNQLSIHDSSGSSSVLPDANTLENDEEVEINSEATTES